MSVTLADDITNLDEAANVTAYEAITEIDTIVVSGDLAEYDAADAVLADADTVNIDDADLDAADAAAIVAILDAAAGDVVYGLVDDIADLDLTDADILATVAGASTIATEAGAANTVETVEALIAAATNASAVSYDLDDSIAAITTASDAVYGGATAVTLTDGDATVGQLSILVERGFDVDGR